MRKTIEQAYEELREIIDGGSESFTHEDAVQYLKDKLAQPEQEPLEYWNAVEGWVKIDEVREHFDSVGCATIYKTAGEGRVPLSLCKAQPEQEPVGFVVDRYNGANTPSLPPTATVAWLNDNPKIGQVLYATTPPKRKPLSDEERVRLWNENHMRPMAFSRAVEAEHGIEDQP